jgi:hypothetical protein
MKGEAHMKSFANRIRFAGLGLAVASSLAFGSVILNDDGTGWVGKGDVQTAFGWNNAAAQKNVNAVSFSFQQTSTYDAVCVWTTGEGTRGEHIHHVTHTSSVAINSTVAYEARKTGQWTGYFLTGFGATTGTTSSPTRTSAAEMTVSPMSSVVSRGAVKSTTNLSPR